MKQKYIFKNTWFGAWPAHWVGWVMLSLADVVAVGVALAVILSLSVGIYEFLILTTILSFWYGMMLWFVYVNEKKHHWFVARRAGWGWRPISWQGWLTILIKLTVATAIIVSASVISESTAQAMQTALPLLALLIVAAMWVCNKTSKNRRWWQR